jgi:hypothetical protein
MLKKVLIIAGLAALSTTMSSCSYVNKSIDKFRENNSTECGNKGICENSPAEVESVPVESVITHHKCHDGCQEHQHEYRVKVTHRMPQEVSAEDACLKEVSCVEITYTTVADKVQTLGYISADSPLPELKECYKPVVHKKVHQQPKVKKKQIKKDSYNKPVKKVEEPTPVIEGTSQVAPAPVAIEENPNTVAPVAPTLSTPTTPTPGATGTTATPPASVVAPTTPSVLVPHSDNTNAQKMPGTAHDMGANQHLTAPAMNNEQVPSGSTMSVGRIATLDYQETQVDVPSSGTVTLDQIADDLKNNPSKNVKIQSYAYAKDGNATEARRNSLQRAIKVRKYLIDKDVNASRISVNAIEDINNKLNKVEVSIEEPKN